MVDKESPDKEPNNSNKRCQLQVAQACNGVARGAATCIAGTKAHKKSSYHQQGEFLWVTKLFESKYFTRQIGRPSALYSELLQFFDGLT